MPERGRIGAAGPVAERIPGPPRSTGLITVAPMPWGCSANRWP